MLMRHNGVLLVGPMLLLLVILYWKNVKQYAIVTGIMTMVIVAAIKGPFYRMMHVQSHSQVTAEMLGVSMTILANILVNEPEALDPGMSGVFVPDWRSGDVGSELQGRKLEQRQMDGR